MTTGLYHGVSVRDAAMMCGVEQSTVRAWMCRYDLPRTGDGQINPFTLLEWWDFTRDTKQAQRRGWRAAS